MLHIFITFNIISFGSAVFILSIFFMVYKQRRSEVIKYYLLFHLMVLVNILLHLWWWYVNTNIDSSQIGYRVAPRVVLFTLCPFFLYYSLMFFHYLAGDPLSGIRKKILTAGSAAFIVFAILPPIACDSLEQAYELYQKMVLMIVRTTDFIAALYVAILLARRYKKTSDSLLRKIMPAIIVLVFLFIAGLFFDQSYKKSIETAINAALPSSLNIIYFLWNLGSIIFFFRFINREAANQALSGKRHSFSDKFRAAGESCAVALKKYERSAITPESSRESFETYSRIIKQERFFTDPELSIQKLAGLLGISRHHLSQIINQNTGLNFYDFLNKYRVEEVIQLMANPENAEKSILRMGFDAGFNSKATFNSAFKKIMGQSPTQYKSACPTQKTV